MQKYLFYGSYTPEGYKGLLVEGGSARIGAAKQALQSVGGSLEAFYYSNGEQDFYIIVNLPDNVSSTAITLAGNASRYATYLLMKSVLLLFMPIRNNQWQTKSNSHY